jgi:DHA1 family bicyclomycin/chloramphenicol resistance-like MFS transporter
MFGDPPDITLFFVGVAILMALNIAVEPNSSALALEPMGSIAGVAASVYGTSFFFIGASLGSLISYLMVDSVFPLVVSFFIIGIATVLLVVGDLRTTT